MRTSSRWSMRRPKVAPRTPSTSTAGWSRQGEPPQRFLVMVARQFRLILQAKDLRDSGVSQAEIASKLRVQNFVAERAIQQASGYRLEQLREAYRLLVEADLNIKRGMYSDEVALELLLFELLTLGRRPGNRGLRRMDDRVIARRELPLRDLAERRRGFHSAHAHGLWTARQKAHCSGKLGQVGRSALYRPQARARPDRFAAASAGAPTCMGAAAG